MSQLLAAAAPAGFVAGCDLIARSLQQHPVTQVFGVVGIPIVEVGLSCQSVGLPFISCRNEQAASYATAAAGYLTGRAQVMLCVAGPGVIHSLAGVANAWANCWPMLLLAGAPPSAHAHAGGFQEAPVIDCCKPFVKFAAQVQHLQQLPRLLSRALHIAAAGRPGPVYIELPAELVSATVSADEAKALLAATPHLPPLPPSLADPSAVEQAIHLLTRAQRPLIVVGKGAAYARAEHETLELIERSQVPFLPTPMGKGTVDDAHPLCIAAARTHALSHADVILLLGARLNWQLHFGLVPRFAKDVKVIAVDISAEEMHSAGYAQLPLVGDIRAVLKQMLHLIKPAATSSSVSVAACSSSSSSPYSAWFNTLQRHIASNQTTIAKWEADTSLPMSYYAVFRVLRTLIPHDAYIISEGANTMDISRSMLPIHLPRRKLDAGTFATMGLGPAQAIAAALYAQQRAASCTVQQGSAPRVAVKSAAERVFAIEGDSAFGFSAMEFETVVRYRLPIIFIVVNNSGIYSGLDERAAMPDDRFSAQLPVTALTPATRYEKIALLAGDDETQAKGYFVTTPSQLEAAVRDALSRSVPCIINVIIRTQQERKPQQHGVGWLPSSASAASKQTAIPPQQLNSKL